MGEAGLGQATCDLERKHQLSQRAMWMRFGVGEMARGRSATPTGRLGCDDSTRTR
jgi:hypothetical protein